LMRLKVSSGLRETLDNGTVTPNSAAQAAAIIKNAKIILFI